MHGHSGARLSEANAAPQRASTIHVIATTDDGTRRALAEARRLSEGVVTRVVLFVPHQVSYAIPTTDPREAPAVITERYRDMVRAVGVDATVRLCLCRHANDVFRWLLLEQSLIVIGGRRRTWWPSRAEQMARWLRKAGHQVVFASF